MYVSSSRRGLSYLLNFVLLLERFRLRNGHFWRNGGIWFGIWIPGTSLEWWFDWFVNCTVHVWMISFSSVFFIWYFFFLFFIDLLCPGNPGKIQKPGFPNRYSVKKFLGKWVLLISLFFLVDRTMFLMVDLYDSEYILDYFFCGDYVGHVFFFRWPIPYTGTVIFRFCLFFFVFLYLVL